MSLSFHNISSLFSQNTTYQILPSSECLQRQIWLRDYYGFCILFAFAYTIVISFCTKRHSFCRRPIPPIGESGRTFVDHIKFYFAEYPGLPVPANLITYRHAQVAYVAAFLCAFNIIGGIFTSYFNIKQAFPNAPIWLAVLYKIFVMCLLTSSLLPVFIGISRGGLCCWLVSCLYCLFHVCLLVASLVQISCLNITEVLQRLLIFLPTMAGFLYLVVYFLTELFHHFQQSSCTSMPTSQPWYHCCQELPTWPRAFISHTTQHIHSLLRPASSQKTIVSAEVEPVRCYCLMKYFIALKKIVKPGSGFSYPPSLCWCLVVSILTQHYLMNQTLLNSYNKLQGAKVLIETMYPDVKRSLIENLLPDNVRKAFVIFTVPKVDSAYYAKLEYSFIYVWLDIVWVCLIAASVLGLVLNILNALRCLYNYQEMSIAIYRGGFKTYPTLLKSLVPHKVTDAVVAYPSYQIAFMVAGFYLQLLLFTSLFFTFSIIVTLNAFTSSYAFIVIYVKFWWPSLLLMTGFITIQQLVIRYVFTQNRGRDYGFNNVRCLHLYIFLTSCYNVFFGLICSIGRLFYSPISSAVNLVRLDISPLAQPMQYKDTGHVKFLGFLYADICHNHPVLKSFIWLLIGSTGNLPTYSNSGRYDKAFLSEAECCMDVLAGVRQADEQKVSSKLDCFYLAIESVESNRSGDALSRKLASHRRAVKRWLIAYTLVRNPGLVGLRKSGLSDSMNDPSSVRIEP